MPRPDDCDIDALVAFLMVFQRTQTGKGMR
jgi:hypothetical protein